VSDLTEERDFLLRSLADLDLERAAGDIGESDYRSLKAQYTARAADVLRRLSSGTNGVAGGRSFVRDEPNGVSAAVSSGTIEVRRAWWRKPLGVLITVAVALGAGLAVARSAGQRQPGQQITGGLPAGQQAKVDSLLAQARQSLGWSPVEALKVFDEILKIDPSQIESLTYRGWLLYQAGLVDQGLEWLDRAVTADPTYPDARVFRGIARFRGKGDAARGAEDLREFLRVAPEHPMATVVKQTLAEAEGSR
jgi:hypothetical protein